MSIAAFKDNKILRSLEHFDKALKKDKSILSTSVNYIPLINYICKTPGASAYIELLGKHEIDINKHYDEVKKYPIHFAINSCDVDNLKKLLEISTASLNYRYDKQTPFCLLCKGITDDNFSQKFECIKFVLDFPEIDVNICDSKSKPPLYHLITSAAQRKEEIVEYLIKKIDFIDLTSFGNETYELMEKNYKVHLDRIKCYKREELLTLDQVEFGLTQNKSNIDIIEMFFASLSNDEDKIKAAQGLIKSAIENDWFDAFMKVLSLVNDEVINMKIDGYTPINYACSCGNIKILKELINMRNINLKDEKWLVTIAAQHLDSRGRGPKYEKHLECFDVIINDKRLSHSIDVPNSYNCTALNYAVKNGHRHCIKELLRKSAYIGPSKAGYEIPVDGINVPILEEYFDTCMKTIHNDHRSFGFSVDYSCLSPKNEVINEIEPLRGLCFTKMNHILNHPFLEIFVALKWLQLQRVFYVNLAIHFFFNVSIIIIVYRAFEKMDLNWFVLIPSIILSLIIFIQRIALEYFKYFKTNFKWSFLIESLFKLAYTLQLPIVIWTLHNEVDRGALVFIITFLITIEFFVIHLGAWSLCSISTYTAMLRIVVQNILTCLPLNIILCLFFGLMIYLIQESSMENQEQIELNLFNSVGKSFSMAIGELNTSEFNFEFGVIAYFIFGSFVFLISIISLNLLNGLAVNDIKEIKSKASLIDLMERIKLLWKLEDIKNSLNCLPFNFSDMPFKERYVSRCEASVELAHEYALINITNNGESFQSKFLDKKTLAILNNARSRITEHNDKEQERRILNLISEFIAMKKGLTLN